MTRLLILDSGAFSVWTKGVTIDLDKYIKFCVDHPDVSYYVNLDVIPGVPNKKRTLTKDSIEESCKQGWRNYKRMLEHLPKNKVIPVYHQNDDVRWLDKYLSFGTPYIGISPANDNTTAKKMQWMRTLRKHLFDGAGKPVVKTHGFAVTSYKLMQFWEWYSVDSASWKLNAAWGCIYLPRKKQGEYAFHLPPLSVAVSPMSPTIQKRQQHVASMSPGVKDLVLEWLAHCNVQLGEGKSVQEAKGYKLQDGETWYNKKTGIVLQTVERGVVPTLEERLKVNARFIRESNKVLPIKHLYYAGAPMPYPLEYKLGRRLLSYEVIGKKERNKCLDKHLESMRKHHAD